METEYISDFIDNYFLNNIGKIRCLSSDDSYGR